MPGSSAVVAIVSEGVTTLTYSAMDNAGNQEAPKTLTVQIDKTKPVITGSRSPAPNATGWNNTNVTVSFSCADMGSGPSGIATNTVAGQTLSAEGAGQSVMSTGNCLDMAGNAADPVTISGINIDKTPPVVAVTGVTNGATYTLGAVPVAGCVTTDALSGVQTSATLSVTGGNANGVGTFIAECTGATDKAGNPGAASVTYQVNGAPPGTDSTFSVRQLVIDQHLRVLFLLSDFTLSQGSNGINPLQNTVTLTIANFTMTIPAGSFRKGPAGVYVFAGKINHVSIEALITPSGSNRFVFQAAAYGANLSGIKNPVTVRLTIGDDSGTTSVNAVIR